MNGRPFRILEVEAMVKHANEQIAAISDAKLEELRS